MALPLDGPGSTAGVLESCATETGPVKRNAIAPNASRRLASDLQAPLRQNAVTPLKTLLRMGALLFLGSESGEQYNINVKAATLSLFIACLLIRISFGEREN
jgi:hypothetical protein